MSGIWVVHKKAAKKGLVCFYIFLLSDLPHVLIRLLISSVEDQSVQGFLPQDVTYDPFSLASWPSSLRDCCSTLKRFKPFIGKWDPSVNTYWQLCFLYKTGQKLHLECIICTFVQWITKAHVWFLVFLFRTAFILLQCWNKQWQQMWPWSHMQKSDKIAPKNMFMDMTVLQMQVHWWHVSMVDYPANMWLFSRMAGQVASSMWLITK